jgi:hypothetical protein
VQRPGRNKTLTSGTISVGLFVRRDRCTCIFSSLFLFLFCRREYVCSFKVEMLCVHLGQISSYCVSFVTDISYFGSDRIFKTIKYSLSCENTLLVHL